MTDKCSHQCIEYENDTLAIKALEIDCEIECTEGCVVEQEKSDE